MRDSLVSHLTLRGRDFVVDPIPHTVDFLIRCEVRFVGKAVGRVGYGRTATAVDLHGVQNTNATLLTD